MDVVEPPKKRGRATKTEDKPAVSATANAPPKKRGRPPKGGETTYPKVHDEAAAEQLEDELVDAVETDQPGKPLPAKRGRGRPKRGSVKPATASNAQEEEAEAAEDAEEVTTKQHWLMKAEQEDREETLPDGSVFNAKFTIDDLREKAGPEPWDGKLSSTFVITRDLS